MIPPAATRAGLRSPEIAPIAPKVILDLHRIENDVCQYHDRDSNTWMNPPEVAWSDVHRYWLTLHGVDNNPR
jgi:SH3-like domain-containing protein